MFAIAFGWRQLLFEHYPVEPAVVQAQLPDGLAVDTYDGDAYLSVVPFTNEAVRPVGMPEWLGMPLPELNLRTYVTHGSDEGVYFFSLDADGWPGVLAARYFHDLPYFGADIDIEATIETEFGDRVRFASRRTHPGARPAEYEAVYEPTGEVFRAEPGSLAAFLTERYRYYTEAPNGLRFAQVDHESWPLQPATATVRRNTLFEADGFDHPDSEPIRHYSQSIDVTASRSLPAE